MGTLPGPPYQAATSVAAFFMACKRVSFSCFGPSSAELCEPPCPRSAPDSHPCGPYGAEGPAAALGGKAANGVHLSAWPQWFWLGALSRSIRVLAIRASGVICFWTARKGGSPGSEQAYDGGGESRRCCKFSESLRSGVPPRTPERGRKRKHLDN